MKQLGVSFLFLFCSLLVFSQCGNYLDLRYKADSCYKENDFRNSALYYKKSLDYSENKRSDYYNISRSLIRIDEIDSALYFYSMAATSGLRYASLRDFYSDSIFQKNYQIKDWKSALTIVKKNTEKLEKSQRKNLSLSKTLLKKESLDQKYRAPSFMELPKNMKDSLWKIQKEIDLNNQSWLKTEISKNGWPGISKVGIEGDNAAWLIAQHADNDTIFQKYCLEALKKAWAAKDTQLKNLAYLEDRILVNCNKEQLYGTQFETVIIDNKAKELKLKPTINVQCLDKRRISMNLPPIEDYLQYAKKRYIKE